MSWHGTAVLVGLLLVTSAVGPALAQPTDAMGALESDNSRALAASQPVLSPTYTFERVPDDPGVIRVSVSLDPPGTLSKLKLSLPEDAVVTGDRGFESETKDGRTVLTWDGQPSDPSVTYRASAMHGDGFGRSGYGTDEWAQFGTGAVTPYVKWWYTGQQPVFEPQYRVADGEPGVATDFRVHLGPHETFRNESDAGTVRVVVPDQADLRANRTAIETTLLAGMRELRIAPRKDDLTVFVAPDPIRGGGAAGSSGSYWVHEDSETGTLDNTWIHEYVHERQAYDTSRAMAWVDEGSAQYYAAFVALRTGGVTYRSFRQHVTDTTYAGADLTTPESWPDADVEYSKGARVVALVDARIQQETDGEQTFQQVMYWMNGHDGEITRAVFADIVERVAGRNLDAFLDRVLTGRHDETLPDDPWLYAGVRIDDHDDDGLTNDEERTAGTGPFTPDTDGDGLTDGREVTVGSDPTVRDTDGDGLPDARELAVGADPTVADTDGDGLDDAEEVAGETDPAGPDTDGDGLSDGREDELRTDPTDADTDGDGTDDAAEVKAGTDPLATPTATTGGAAGVSSTLGAAENALPVVGVVLALVLFVLYRG
ncbi:hypothetical protein ACFQGE_09695 [Halomicroarcula sp. GCM10025817]|uniref:hypothetical protein n=1 Tax=Haloarcula TaxID=2237 RepID=UPI0023E80F44|nr:hypothetical protein [Halomicroarcula sp. SYNS111]